MVVSLRKIGKLLMGVLLLITFSYSIPSVSQQRSCPQTEWVQIRKAAKQQSFTAKYRLPFRGRYASDKHHIVPEAGDDARQEYQDQADEFNCRIACYKINVLARLRQTMSQQFDITIQKGLIPKIITTEKNDSLS